MFGRCLNAFALPTGSSRFRLANGQGRITQPLRSSPIPPPSGFLVKNGSNTRPQFRRYSRTVVADHQPKLRLRSVSAPACKPRKHQRGGRLTQPSRTIVGIRNFHPPSSTPQHLIQTVLCWELDRAPLSQRSVKTGGYFISYSVYKNRRRYPRRLWRPATPGGH